MRRRWTAEIKNKKDENKMNRIILLIVVLFSFVCVAFGQSDDTILVEGWKVDVLDYLLMGMAALGAYLLERVIAYLRKKQIDEEAVGFIAEGVAKVSDQYMRQLRESIADRRLTKEEVYAANQQAYGYAKNIAKGPVLKYMKKRGVVWASSVIKGVMSKNK